MALNTEQLALINNLTYTAGASPLPSIYDYEGLTVRDYLQDYYAKQSLIKSDKNYTTFTDGQEWSEIMTAVSNDPELCNLKITSVYHDVKMGDRAIVLTDTSYNEAIVAYKGTGAKEWPDNFHGGGATEEEDGVSTPQQEKALAWYRDQYQKQGLGQYSTVTVTGHSKGGNKAQYITLEEESVSRCVSFDGQGFSDEYIASRSDEIYQRAAKITNHSAENDYVNILLNSVGTQKYYEINSRNVKSGGFAEQHCPNTFLHFDENGNAYLVEGKQGKEVADIDRFLNSYLRSLDPQDKADTLKTVGELVEKGMDGEFMGLSVSEVINQYLNNDRYRDKLVPLVGYVIRYQEENPDTLMSIKTILTGLGMEEAGDTIEKIMKYATNPLIWRLYRLDHDISGNWITRKFVLSDMFKEMGITSDKDKETLLNLIYDIIIAHDNVDVIKDGEDQFVSFKIGKDKRKPRVLTDLFPEIAQKDMPAAYDCYDFMIETDKLNLLVIEMQQNKDKLNKLEKRIENVLPNLQGSLVYVKSSVIIQKQNIHNNCNSMENMQNALGRIIQAYKASEARIMSGY